MGIPWSPEKRKPPVDRFWAFVRKTDACWLWTGCKDRKGYGKFTPDWKRPAERAHRFSWSLHNGQAVPDGMLVLHRCDNPGCVRPDHLRVGTAFENSADMLAKGRYVSGTKGLIGEASPNSKITADDVREIRRLLAAGELSMNKIAARFGVTKQPVRDIAHGRRWKHVA